MFSDFKMAILEHRFFELGLTLFFLIFFLCAFFLASNILSMSCITALFVSLVYCCSLSFFFSLIVCSILYYFLHHIFSSLIFLCFGFARHHLLETLVPSFLLIGLLPVLFLSLSLIFTFPFLLPLSLVHSSPKTTIRLTNPTQSRRIKSTVQCTIEGRERERE